jgi:hypothetical protein
MQHRACISSNNRPQPSSTDENSDKWLKVSKAVYAAAFSAAGNKRMLSGPDWSNTYMDTVKLQEWLNGVKGYLNEVSVHLYGGDLFSDKKIDQLLTEDRMVSEPI